MYADYDFYKTQYYGALTEAEFLSASVEAEAYVNMITFGRVKDLETVPDEVKFAVCAVADEIQRGRKTRTTGNIKSESNDGESITFGDAMSDEECQANMHRKAEMYLGNTGLLYRGFCCEMDGVIPP